MNRPGRKWLVAAVAIVLCAAVLGIWWLRGRSLDSTADLLRHLPQEGSLVFHVDLAALRNSGWAQQLTAGPVAEEPEYLEFVRKTGFDYRKDLDSVVASFHPAAVYMILRGRFQWEDLQAYARQQGGACQDSVCQMRGSTPERNISFLPLNPDVMALAVSRDRSAARHLLDEQPEGQQVRVFPDPVWLAIPGSVFEDMERVPEGTRAFARALQGSREAVLALAPAGERLEARLTVVSRSDPDAQTLAARLTETTQLLRDMIAREKGTPNPRDLSGVLTGGRFERRGSEVLGTWPIEREFIQGILGSAPQ